MRYAPEKVVALLDTERAGETELGFPIVGTVEDALSLGPNAALVGVATAGGRFPPAFLEQIRTCIENGLDVDNGLHEFLTADPSSSSSRESTTSRCATSESRRPTSTSRPARTSRCRRRSS